MSKTCICLLWIAALGCNNMGGSGGGGPGDGGSASAQVTWLDDGGRKTAASATSTLGRIGSLDKLLIFVNISAGTTSVLLLTATAPVPLVAGEFTCAQVHSSSTYYAQMAYALSAADDAPSLQDCTITVTKVPATTNALAVGTFSGTAVFTSGMHMLTEGTFSVPTQVNITGVDDRDDAE